MDIAARLGKDPTAFAEAGYGEADGLPRERLEALQLGLIARRFRELHSRVAILDRLALDVGVDAIGRLEDVIPLLFPHTVFKSYPLTWLESGRFDRLTRWLGALTAVRLQPFDCEGLDSIDAWIERLDRRTELRVVHTFGTSGKLSFVPHTRAGWKLGGKIVANCIRDWHGRETGPDLLRRSRPLIYPGYRFGAGAVQRGVASAVELFAGGDDNTLFLYPRARFSADVASLAGRLQAAQMRGESEKLVLTPFLRERHRQFAERERNRSRDLQHFLEAMIHKYRNQDVYLLGVWPVLYDWAQAGLRAGLREVFGPGTVLHTGGGMKGRTLEEGWHEQIFDFVGVRRHFEFYAMSELTAGCARCEEGNYHVPPVTVPMVLDPQTGGMLPRSGRMRGRFAAFDLLAQDSWGGVASGDEVTLAGWEECCRCGRPGVYVEPDIRRLRLDEGGTDKISCAGSVDAYERAVAYLANVAESAV